MTLSYGGVYMGVCVCGGGCSPNLLTQKEIVTKRQGRGGEVSAAESGS